VEDRLPYRSRAHFGAWPVIAFLVLVPALYLFRSRDVFDPYPLVAILNFAFLTVTSLVVAFFGFRTYLRSGLVQMLYLGSAVAFMGVGSFVAGILINTDYGLPAGIAVHNLSALVSSLFHVLTAFASSVGTVHPDTRQRAKKVYLCAGAVLAFVAVVLFASLHGYLPAFVGEGALRQIRPIILSVAMAFFALSAILVWWLYARTNRQFLYWYGLALAVTAMGMLAVAGTSTIGTPITWAGRLAQYLGGIYLVIAVTKAARQASRQGSTVEEVMANVFRESEVWYGDLVLAASDAIIAADEESRVLLWNPAAERIFGFKESEVIGSHLPDLLFPVEAASRNGPPVPDGLSAGDGNAGARETMLRRKDGNRFPAEISVAPQGSSPLKISTLIVRDVSERKTAEQEREMALDFLYLINRTEGTEDLLERSSLFFGSQSRCDTVAFLIKEGDGYITYRPERPAADFLPSLDIPCVSCADKLFAAHRVDGEVPDRAPLFLQVLAGSGDGHHPYLTARGSFWTNSGGGMSGGDGPVGADSVDMCDICRGSGHESLALIPLYCGDERLGVLQLGYRRPDALTGHAVAFWEKLAGYLAVALAKARAEDALRDTDEKLRATLSAVEHQVEERTAELRNAYEALQKETEERRFLQKQLLQSQKLEALGTLAGGIAHDFNNILAAVIGFSEMARDHSPEGSPAWKQMTRVFEAGLRGRDLIKRILTFSRQGDQTKRPLRLSDVVAETLKLLRASLPSTISIQMHLKEGSGVVLADHTQMEQVVMNLCTNAAYAMRRTGGKIAIELDEVHFLDSNDLPDRSLTPGNYLRLSVQDTGEGIRPDVLDRIFDPFFTTKSQGDGTGLGLSVVHGIVSSHEGAITVTSEPGNGSTFHVYLPRHREERAPAPADGGGGLPVGGERIMLIDDEEVLVEMGTEMLRELGYRVVSKTNSREALAVLRSDPSRFDLVVTDQTMPFLTGLELARELRAFGTQMPIILCTGFNQSVGADEAHEAGVSAFVMKPLTREEMARTVRKVLDGKERTAGTSH
jgi:PAS domain S-box-containing protein